MPVKKINERKVQVSYTVDADNVEFLTQLAEKRGVSASSIANNIISKYKKLVKGE